MLTKIRVVTFLLALVIGSFLFLEKAYAQTAVSPGGAEPCCPTDVDCPCEKACVVGVSGTLCTVGSASEGYLACGDSCTSLTGMDFAQCKIACATALEDCLANCR